MGLFHYIASYMSSLHMQNKATEFCWNVPQFWPSPHHWILLKMKYQYIISLLRIGMIGVKYLGYDSLLPVIIVIPLIRKQCVTTYMRPCTIKLWRMNKTEHISGCSHHHITNYFDTLRPRQHGRRFPHDIFQRIFFDENCCILIRSTIIQYRRQ